MVTKFSKHVILKKNALQTENVLRAPYSIHKSLNDINLNQKRVGQPLHVAPMIPEPEPDGIKTIAYGKAKAIKLRVLYCVVVSIGFRI